MEHDVWHIFVMCSIISRSEGYWGTFQSLEFTYCLLSALIQTATFPLGHINWVIIKQGPERQKRCKTFGKPDGAIIVPLLIRHTLVQWRRSTDFFGCTQLSTVTSLPVSFNPSHLLIAFQRGILWPLLSQASTPSPQLKLYVSGRRVSRCSGGETKDGTFKVV